MSNVAWATQRRPGDSAVVHSALETQGSGRSPPDAPGHGPREGWHPRVFSRTDPAACAPWPSPSQRLLSARVTTRHPALGR